MSHERGGRTPIDEEALRLRNENRRYFLNRSEALLEDCQCGTYSIKKDKKKPLRASTPPVTVTVNEQPVDMQVREYVHFEENKITRRIAIVEEVAGSKPHDLFNVVQIYSHDSSRVKTAILNESTKIASNEDVVKGVMLLNFIATGLMGLKS